MFGLFEILDKLNPTPAESPSNQRETVAQGLFTWFIFTGAPPPRGLREVGRISKIQIWGKKLLFLFRTGIKPVIYEGDFPGSFHTGPSWFGYKSNTKVYKLARVFNNKWRPAGFYVLVAWIESFVNEVTILAALLPADLSLVCYRSYLPGDVTTDNPDDISFSSTLN